MRIHENLQKASRIMFYMVALFSVLAIVLDTVSRSEALFLVYGNIAVIAVIVFSTIAYMQKKEKQKLLFAIISYAVIVNSFCGLCFSDYSSAVFIYYFLRESVFIVFLLTITAYLSGKIHALAIGALYVVFDIVMSLYYGDAFLYENLFLIPIVWLGYSVCVYIFMFLLDKALNQLHSQNVLIQKQNQELKEMNSQLLNNQKIVEEQNRFLMQANEDLNESKKIKDKFFSITAHDLKNYSHAVVGFTELLKRNHRKYSPVRLAEKIEVLNDTAISYQKLLEELVQWSKIQTRRIVIKPRVINAYDESLAVIDVLKHTIAKKELLFTNSIHKELNFVVDPRVFKTVLRNLLSNAIKFTHQGGSVIVRSNETANSVAFSVSDSGIGMDEETSSSIFELGENNSKKGTDNEKGTGLGLQICKELIELSGGSISVISHVNRGSVFSFDIPKATLPIFE